jgi:predicted nucleic acid-binding protein
MNWLLDTNAVSEISKPSPDPNCMAWLEAHEEDCYLSTITLSEMRWGIERLVDGKRKRELEREFDFLMQDFQGKFYEFDGAAAYEWGRYAARLETDYGADWWQQFDFRDTQIAAISREYGLTIATRNEKHFPLCATVNPWTQIQSK